MIEIKHKDTGEVLHTVQGDTLRGADLGDADLRCADLIGADLRGADLIGADLRGADLRDADLRGVNLCHSDLRGADARGATIDAEVTGIDIETLFSILRGNMEVQGE